MPTWFVNAWFQSVVCGPSLVAMSLGPINVPAVPRAPKPARVMPELKWVAPHPLELRGPTFKRQFGAALASQWVSSIHDPAVPLRSHFPSMQVFSHHIQVLRLRFDSDARQLHALFSLIFAT